jgi:hypothetical protein
MAKRIAAMVEIMLMIRNPRIKRKIVGMLSSKTSQRGIFLEWQGVVVLSLFKLRSEFVI